MSGFLLTLYLGVEPDEGHDFAVELILGMTEMPGGLSPEVDQEVEFMPGNPEPMQFKIDTCQEPSGDGTIELVGWRWITTEHMYFHWLAMLKRDPRISVISEREVNTELVEPTARARLQESNTS